jgi:leucyl-tRNA synthetase
VNEFLEDDPLAEEAAPSSAAPFPESEDGQGEEIEDILPEDRDMFMPSRPAPSTRRGNGDEGTVPVRPPIGSPRVTTGPDGSIVEEPAEDEEEEDEEAAPPPPPESRFHPFRLEPVRRWLPVDAAFGRHDQGVISLLFLRAMTKFLNEIGEVPFSEPFYRYLRVGPVATRAGAARKPGRGTAREPSVGVPRVEPSRASVPRADGPRADGQKDDAMKAATSGLAPRDAIQRQGSDAVRIALLGLVPPNRRCLLSEHDLWTARRFLDRIWRQVNLRLEKGKFVSRSVLESKHRLIHNTTQRLRRFKFHTALSSIHEFLNFLEHPSTSLEEMDRSALRTFLIVLWPFAPHLAGELWNRIGETGDIAREKWPEANKELLRAPEKEIPLRLEGRIVSRIKVPAALEGEKLEAMALKDEKVQAALAGRPVGRVIAVVDRTVNILFPREPKEPKEKPAAAASDGEAARPGRAASPRPPTEEASSPSSARPPVPPR